MRNDAAVSNTSRRKNRKSRKYSLTEILKSEFIENNKGKILE